MTVEAVIAALNLPVYSRVDQRVPKKLLLENSAPTAADKRMINEGIEEIQWLAALKPATCGVPEFRDETRNYLEIAVLKVKLREQAKEARLIELMHRAVPYPVLLLLDRGGSSSVSLANKRQAMNDADKVVLDGEPISASVPHSSSEISTVFLTALDMARQPQASLLAIYQGWMDSVVALQAAALTGVFTLVHSYQRLEQRRQVLQNCLTLQARIVALRAAASKASQIAARVELNIELRRVQNELSEARSML